MPGEFCKNNRSVTKYSMNFLKHNRGVTKCNRAVLKGLLNFLKFNRSVQTFGGIEQIFGGKFGEFEGRREKRKKKDDYFRVLIKIVPGLWE